MQQPRRASPANPQPAAQPPARVSSIPRPTVMTAFDSPIPNSHLDSTATPQASTPDAINFYSQRRPVGAAAATTSPTSNSTLPVRTFDRPSYRSASGPALTSSRSSPAITPAERLQKTSIKDLVAKFNQNSDASSPSQPNLYPRKPAPPTSSGAQDPNRPARDSTSQGQWSTPQQHPFRDQSRTFESARSNFDTDAADTGRPRTADESDSPQRSAHRPLFGEVVSSGQSDPLGHGIPQWKQRRGSEGSMHYPNAMFPNPRGSYAEDSPILDDTSGAQAGPTTSDAVHSHSRSRSDVSGNDPLSPTSRVPVRVPVPDQATAQPTSSTARRPVTPPSAGQSRYETTPGQSSSSGKRLNAIISAPAPKVSPPLRSSRPRQDVTTARSTSPTKLSKNAPAMATASPERTKLFAGVDMDLAARRNSIRKALRQDRERNMYGSQLSPQRAVNRPGTAPLATANQMPGGSVRSPVTRNPGTDATNLPQLSSAAYTQPPPALKLNVQDVSRSAADEPGSGTTQFEEDDSPTLGVPGGFPKEAQNRNFDDGASDRNEPVQKPSRTVLSQIMEMRRDGAPQLPSGSHLSLSGSQSLDRDDAETIQIMLSDTPALNRTSAGWQNRDLHYGADQRRDGSDNTDPESMVTQDESTSSTPSAQTRGSINERQSSSTTLDKDPYHLINRILDQYRESGVVTPDMIQDFQQHILETDPDLSRRDERESMDIARAALEDIIRDHSQSASVTPESVSGAFPYAQNRGIRPYWETGASDVTVTTIHQDDKQAAPGTSEVPEDSRPIPPPKDSDYNPLASPATETTRSDDTVTGDDSSQEISPPDGQPILPEMPSTDGHLGLNPGGLSRDLYESDQSMMQTQNGPPRDLMNGQISSAIDAEFPPLSTPIAPAEPMQRLDPSSAAIQSPPNLSGTHSRTVSFDKDSQMASSSASQNPEQRRLTQRRHLIKELVDTEYSFNQDMKVIEDIYKGTASSVQALTQEDQRVLFGNSAQVVEFSEAFLDALKQASRSVYKMPRANQWRVNPNLSESNSGSQTEESSLASFESTDDERDRKTFIGDAFNNHVSRLEKVYSEYLKNHDFANQRLQKLQTIAQVQLWLSECHAYANDITSAWDLDSLLVKPVQRILKYPLLLRSLLEQTPADHPDHDALVLAVKQSEDISHRINESKKRAELLEQVVNKNAKRKEFDFSKVFSRRTDKIAHRVGLSEAVEDPDYKRLAEKFGGRYFQLQIVMRDIEMYKKKTEEFMTQFNRYIGAIEELIDVGHTNSPEIESKWRKFAVTIREMTAIAYADHDLAVRKHCIDPIVTLIKLHDGPQRLMQKRKKRIVEYAKFLTVKNRGDKVDKKLQEQGDQFVALNDTLKDELPKLFTLTAKLVEACLKNFVDLQTQWHSTWQKKIKNILEEQQVPQDWGEIVEAFNSDFSYTEAHVLSLGICNGSLLAETSNFLSSSSSFTMTDDNSSTKRPSMAANRISPSVPQTEFNRGSGGSLGLGYASPRSSSESQGQSGQPNGNSQYQPRYRADSNLSAHSNNAWNNSPAAGQRAPPSYNPAAYVPNQQQGYRYRHSSEATGYPRQPNTSHPSGNPNAGYRMSDSARPVSSSTFYSASSAAATPRETGSNSSEPRYSSLFSSAMPMSDSPEDNLPPSPNALGEEVEPTILFTAASMFEFNLDRSRKEAGYPYLNYMAGEIFNVIGEKGELWLARNQDDPTNATGWIWEKHFAKLVTDD